MKDRGEKSSWSIVWSWAAVQQCIQMPDLYQGGDLADKDFMRTVFKEHADIDTVIPHDLFTGHESMADPLKYFDNNTGMIKLLKSCMV